jgi:hypothetical protein
MLPPGVKIEEKKTNSSTESGAAKRSWRIIHLSVNRICLLQAISLIFWDVTNNCKSIYSQT